MRAKLLAILFIALSIGVASAQVVDPTALLCPFPSTPSQSLGLVSISNTVAGECVGTIIAVETATYQDVPHTTLTNGSVPILDDAGNVIGNETVIISSPFEGTINTNGYHYGIVGLGSTSYASSTQLTGNNIVSVKSLTQNSGYIGQDEGYSSYSINISKGLEWNDAASGGSFGAISEGSITSSTALLTPIDVNYQVAYAKLDGSADKGFGAVYHSINSQEGVNGEIYATSSSSDFTAFSGDFTLVSDYSAEIIHPFSSQTNQALTNINGLC